MSGPFEEAVIEVVGADVSGEGFVMPPTIDRSRLNDFRSASRLRALIGEGVEVGPQAGRINTWRVEEPFHQGAGGNETRDTPDLLTIRLKFAGGDRPAHGPEPTRIMHDMPRD
jgi:hypothetical protein